jgi:ferredoxin
MRGIPCRVSSKGGHVKVQLDTERCQGHGRCAYFAPEVFSLDDEGHSVLERDPESAEEAENVRVAVLNCPERAITADTAET